MADDNAYEIMPYKEIVQLKNEIADLKKKSGDTSSRDLIGSMNTLTKNMDNMLQLFKTAAEEMKLEEQETSHLGKYLQPMMEKLDDVLEQNRTIAEGMVAIADIVKEFVSKADHEKLLQKINPMKDAVMSLDEDTTLKIETRETQEPEMPPAPSPQQFMPQQQMPPAPMPGMPPSPRSFGMQQGRMPQGMPTPPMPQAPKDDFADIEDFDLGPLPPLPPEPPKKKGLFGFNK